MKKYSWIMAVAVVLAFGLSGAAQEKPAPPAKPGQAPAAPARPQERLKNALGITPEQEARLKDHQKAVAEQQKTFAEQMKKLREEMQALRKDGAKPDLNKTNDLIDRMFKLRADQAKAGARNRLEREKIFTPEQLEKMKNGRGMLMGRGMGLMGQGPMGRGMRAPDIMRGLGPGPGMGRMGLMMNRGRMRGMQGRGMMMNRGRMLNRQGRAVLMNRGRIAQALKDRLLRLRRSVRDLRLREE